MSVARVTLARREPLLGGSDHTRKWHFKSLQTPLGGLRSSRGRV